MCWPVKKKGWGYEISPQRDFIILVGMLSHPTAVNNAYRGGRDESMRAREEERQKKVQLGSRQKEEGDSKVNRKHQCLALKATTKEMCDISLSLSLFLLR